jgi:fucose permease
LATRVISPYLITVAVLVILVVIIFYSSLPEIETGTEDKTLAAANINQKSIIQFPHVLLGTLATIFISE